MNNPDILPIPNYLGYFASTDGTIWTEKRKGGNDRSPGRKLATPRPLTAHLNGSGYLTVNLDIEGKAITRRVHRLVLETFVGAAPEGYHACHYPDPTKTNNQLENLRWGSASDNAKDRYRDRPNSDYKECLNCHDIKLKTDFYRDKRASDGLKTECKTCHKRTAIDTRDKDKKRIANREFMRRYRMTK